MNRQRVLLVVFLGLFICSLVYSFLRMPRQKTVDKLKYLPGMTAQTSRVPQNKDADTVRVRLDLLDAKPGRPFAGGKNIFQGVHTEAPKKTVIPLPLPPPPPERKPPPPPPVAATVAPPVAEPTPLQREMATFTFLGLLKKDNRKTIFLSNGKEIYLVKKGDRIAGKYEVTSLTDEALTISSATDGGEILIPLIENKPLNAPRK
jgi:hypothetical protein